jgi:hypothetical protein
MAIRNVLKFNNTYIDIANNNLLTNIKKFTIEIICYIASNNVSLAVLISKKLSSSSPYYSYCIRLDENSTKIRTQTSTTSTEYHLRSNSYVKLNDYNHIVFLSNGISRKIYLNGQLDAQDNNGNIYIPSSTYPLNIGRWPGNYYYFSGKMAHISLYDTNILQEDILKSISYKNDKYNSNLVSYYKFDEGSGNILYDHSGNNNHGTIYNGTWIEEEVPYQFEQVKINSINYNIIND